MNLNTLHSEMQLLGGIIANGINMDAIDIFAKLPSKAFTNHRNRELFDTIRHMHECNMLVQPVTVAEYIDNKKDTLFDFPLSEITDFCKDTYCSPALYKPYAKNIRQAMYAREAIEAIDSAKEILMGDGSVESAVQEINSILGGLKLETDRKLPRTFEEIAKDYPDELEKRQLPSCIETGFPDLDKVIGRVANDDLIIIAARPAMGKTELAAAIANNVSKSGSIYIASMEMSDIQIYERIISIDGNYSSNNLQNFFDNDDSQMARVGASIQETRSRQGYIQDMTGMTPHDVAEDVEYVKRQTNDLRLIVVDHFGLFETGDGGRAQELGKISRGLKQLAKKTKTPVLLLCQLNRSLESRTNKRPIMSDLRECGDLEQDANKILFIYRDEVYNKDSPNKGVAEIIQGKNREKKMEDCLLTFTDGHFHNFCGTYVEESKEKNNNSGGFDY